MKTRAAVAWQAGQPLTIEELDLEGRRAGEVLVKLRVDIITRRIRDLGIEPQ